MNTRSIYVSPGQAPAPAAHTVSIHLAGLRGARPAPKPATKTASGRAVTVGLVAGALGLGTLALLV